jgi:hypothetical protein
LKTNCTLFRYLGPRQSILAKRKGKREKEEEKGEEREGEEKRKRRGRRL